MSTDPITLSLTVPIKDGNDDVTELKFKRPNAGDFAAMDEAKGQQSGAQVLLARSCNLSVKAVKQLDGYDYLQAMEVIGSFLQKPRPTGEISSET
jgi:hypothetical protein